jgi:L-ascorbate metabolism protein UlaG (beta-lactamase superfamily)
MRLPSLLASLLILSAPALAQAPPSECLAVAQAARVHLAAATPLSQDQVAIRFIGHSTFLLETAGGIRVATDYNGRLIDPLPQVVTMNRAHSTHYTLTPDPAIQHVLRGWGENDAPAKHDVTVGDMRIRNVTTDIRNSTMTRITDGNSIFIFEAGGLCIGHLGHLHHELTPGQIGWIGRLDVVMVPVDGRMTMPHANMMAVLKELNVRTILPMHIFGPDTLAEFLTEARKNFKVEYRDSAEIIVSQKTMPDQPTVFVLPGY